MTDNDKRRFTRVPFDAEVVLHYGARAWPTDVVDVSSKGLLAVAPEDFNVAPGESMGVDLILNEEISIDTQCTLMHRTGDRIGLRIDRIDMESIIHLRRLLELNLGDPELLERELSGLHD